MLDISIDSGSSSSKTSSKKGLGWTLTPVMTVDTSLAPSSPTALEGGAGDILGGGVGSLWHPRITAAEAAAETNATTTQMVIDAAHEGPRHLQASPTS